MNNDWDWARIGTILFNNGSIMMGPLTLIKQRDPEDPESEARYFTQEELDEEAKTIAAVGELMIFYPPMTLTAESVSKNGYFEMKAEARH